MEKIFDELTKLKQDFLGLEDHTLRFYKTWKGKLLLKKLDTHLLSILLQLRYFKEDLEDLEKLLKTVKTIIKEK